MSLMIFSRYSGIKGTFGPNWHKNTLDANISIYHVHIYQFKIPSENIIRDR